MEAHSEKLRRNIAQLLNDTKYSDATIRIHDVTLPVHKSIICTQSVYFEKAFQEAFVEGSSGVLTFNDGSGAAHWRVFEYLYTGDYSDDLSNNFQDDPALLKDPRVYALADMFFLYDLKDLCTTKLQGKLQTLWTSDSFPECVREIYSSTPDSDRTMRSAVFEVAKTHIRELGKKTIFKDLICEGGDFAVDCFESVLSLVPPALSPVPPAPPALSPVPPAPPAPSPVPPAVPNPFGATPSFNFGRPSAPSVNLPSGFGRPSAGNFGSGFIR